MFSLSFTNTPKIPWVQLLMSNKTTFSEKESIPRIEARWSNASIRQLEAYNNLTHFQGARLPIAFPQVLATPLHLHLLTHASFPLPSFGLIHTEQYIHYRQPIVPEEPFDLLCWVEGHNVARKGIQFNIHTHLIQRNSVCWEGICTILSRAVNGHNQRSPRISEPVLDKGTPQTWTLPENLGRAYAKVSRDFNPIHLHAWTAKPFGFSRHIVHGMWTMARSLYSFSTPITTARVHFLRPVFLPSTVYCHTRSNNNRGAFVVSHPQSGKTHLFGHLEF